MDTQLVNTINTVFTGSSITYAAIFGSLAKGTATPESDIDILFDYDPTKRLSLFDLLELQNKLETQLGKDVDLVPIGGLKEDIKKEVLESALTVYEKR
ncbi:MAG: nucleotidyltransferase domain-containing protein [Candidatus Doudnabacteria bacterium]|nr:nucleotidyltransferase domain-containing protein [Candidatus Doudnabacteria bacterium]